MANLQIAEVLHGAKVFVLHVADEVSFKARSLLAMDRGIVDEFEDEVPTETQAQPAEEEAPSLPLQPSPAVLAYVIARSMFPRDAGLPMSDDSEDQRG